MCLQEHQQADVDDIIGCNEGRTMTTLVLPKAYPLYDSKINDINEDDGNKNDSGDEVGSSTSFATAVAGVVEEAGTMKNTRTTKEKTLHSRRSATAVRRSKQQRTQRVAGIGNCVKRVQLHVLAIEW